MSTYVAIFAMILAYVAVVAAYLALRTLAKLRRASSVLARGARGPAAHSSLVEATQYNTDRTDVLAEELAALRAQLAKRPAGTAPVVPIAAQAPAGAPSNALSNVALVRYDAFGEMSGRMSFSLALLDEHGDGVTISAISGTGDTRVYAKGIAGGKSEHELSPEESQAVSSALERRRGLLGRKSA